jgi:hypothetical protein
MSQLTVRLYSQQGIDATGSLQAHQWAEVPSEISIAYLSGGLKKIRRMTERYFSYRFSPESKRVRAVWRSGEPHLELRRSRLSLRRRRTLAHLGRLRAAATADIFRGYLEILDGDLIDPAARLAGRPWPADMPWVAPSAGEFDVAAEHERPPYLGTFEIRVQRAPTGCTLHTILQDFPAARRGSAAKLWERPDQPMARTANLDFLQQEIRAAAREAGHDVRFEITDVPGVPERLHAIYAQQHLSPA